MIEGARIRLRPIREDDWPAIEEWGQRRDALWGSFQRFQLDHVPLLRQAYEQTGLLTRESGFLLAELCQDLRIIGFVRYTLLQFPDADTPYPEIGFGIPDSNARGRGYATEAVGLLVDYLLAGYPAERVAAFTDIENLPAQSVLQRLGFQREGVLRRSTFRDGRWHDMAVYAVLREEWQPSQARG